MHPYEAVNLLGLVRTKPGDTAEQIKAAEQSAMDNLRRNSRRWGITPIKRGVESGSTVAYREADVLAYMECREREAEAR
jgi:hypothetical protein